MNSGGTGTPEVLNRPWEGLEMFGESTRRVRWSVAAVVAVLAAAGILAAVASAAVPQNTASPAIGGVAKEGSTLTATTGTWANSPTSFAYQWQRCASDGTGCGDVSGATDKTYTPTSGDVSHTIRVVVTATNADGKASASSDPTAVVGSKDGPTNTVKPTVTGTAIVGEQLRVGNGTWTPAPTSVSRQWQRCNADGDGCLNISGATGATYGVRSADVGKRLRALVTAHTSSGATTAVSNATDVVADQTTTVTTTTTVPGNKAPSIAFRSLRRVGARVYARFRVCGDHTGRIRVIERDNKARALSARRRFAVTLSQPCGTFSRSWVPAARFRGHGRLVVTLRAVDRSGALSRIASRSLFKR
jgi:hypothetical protein